MTNILQINRLENQKIKPALHPFNLSEALCRCILNYESELDEKEIELYTDGKSIRRIFDKFYQADPSHATQGNGIGLTLTKRIIDLLEGEILAESMPGVSSAFTVKLHAKGGPLHEPARNRKKGLSEK